MSIITKKITWGGVDLEIEYGRMAQQATGAVLVKYGNTHVLTAVTAAPKPTEGVDFFPLSVHYIEKAYAAGKIPGGFLKRESKPSDHEVLTSRLIDRPIRPLFHDHFNHETQVICTVLSYDGENATDIPAFIGTSAALAVSGLPFAGPVGAARIGYIDGEYVLNPNREQLGNSQLDLMVAGTAEGVLMVESEAHELSEDQMLGAVDFGHNAYQEVINIINELKADVNPKMWPVPEAPQELLDLTDRIQNEYGDEILKGYTIPEKKERRSTISHIADRAMAAILDEDEELKPFFTAAFKKVEYNTVRNRVLNDKQRIDNRGFSEVRPISTEVGLLPRVHGSGLFTRGETQVLGVATLGTADDEQMTDGLIGTQKEHFLLHYNFPPYSVGEAGRFGPPGRREVGHGKLAWRALNPVMPSKEDFPYTVRVVADVLACNGSSSMGTVCASSMCLMDAGVPLKAPVAGIAMGLVTDEENGHYAILSDIMGDEDFLGDMDFKVAGTTKGITALQMDIKITSITSDIMKEALAQAKAGRHHILNEMQKSIESHREEISHNAPRIVSFQIKKDKIGEVIGPGGKVIREITETTNTKIEILPEGDVRIFAMPESDLDEAVSWVKGIGCDPEVGEEYNGKVVKITDYGAFVNYARGKDGFLHISEVAHERISDVKSHLNEGEMIDVKIVGFDDRGRVRLSRKALLPKP